MTENKTEAKDKLTAFCAEDNTRYAITQPWVKGGYRYYTDGRIVVRVPTADADYEGELSFPPGEEVFAPHDFNAVTDWRPWPTEEPPTEMEKCRNCKGTGKKICDTCDGDGTTECPECGSFIDCPDSGGTASKVACAECRGAGAIRRPAAVTIGKRHVAGRFVVKVRDNCEEAQWSDSGEANECMLFRFKGGQGLLMPLLGL